MNSACCRVFRRVLDGTGSGSRRRTPPSSLALPSRGSRLQGPGQPACPTFPQSPGIILGSLQRNFLVLSRNWLQHNSPAGEVNRKNRLNRWRPMGCEHRVNKPLSLFFSRDLLQLFPPDHAGPTRLPPCDFFFALPERIIRGLRSRPEPCLAGRRSPAVGLELELVSFGSHLHLHVGQPPASLRQ